jgi:predicted enzyme related to lactoylglutathione lyase
MAHHAKMEHAELVSKDPAATQRFLEKAFGLQFTVRTQLRGPPGSAFLIDR